MPGLAIEVEGLTRQYGSRVAVDGVSFSVQTGEIFGIIGRNGAGKTTTVECLQGLRRRTRGSIRVLGLDPASQRRELSLRIGSQLQESALAERIKVWEALDLFAGFNRVATDWRSLLVDLGLERVRKTAFANLSGGQQQRLLIALALINRPELAFLDELTQGLDPDARREAWSLVLEMRDRGTTVVLVTHFLEEAERLCDRVAVMDQGRLACLDTPQALINQHGGGLRLLFTSSQPSQDWISSIPGVEGVTTVGNRVTVHGRGAMTALVAAGLVERGTIPDDLRTEQPTLEEAFLNIVGSSKVSD